MIKASPKVVSTSRFVAVGYPISGALAPSSFQVWFDKATGAVVGDAAVYGVQGNDGVEVTIVANGAVSFRGVVPNDAQIALQETFGNSRLSETYGGLSCLNACLAGMGIANWIIAAIGIACGIACGGTMGLGCLACAAGLSFILGGELGYCIEECYD